VAWDDLGDGRSGVVVVVVTMMSVGVGKLGLFPFGSTRSRVGRRGRSGSGS
jgi:hypothetical protein